MSDVHPTPSFEADFSLVAGGPAHRLQERLGLIKPGSPNPARRVALSILLTWVPLLVLSAAQGLAIGHEVRIPFLYDFGAYGRFLVAVPLLILAERPIQRQVAEAVAHFVRSGLVPERYYAGFELALHRASSLRDSTVAEMVLLGLTALSVVISRHEFPFSFSTWRSVVWDATHTLTLAGWWHVVVSMALFQFLVWRWLWRLLIWYGLLWRVSRLDLQLIPTHPDGAAGLGFLGEAQRSWGIIVFALSAASAGLMANEIVYAGGTLKRYEIAIAGLVLLLLLASLGPLLMFTPRLNNAMRKSLHDYSALAISHHQMFDRKWVQGDNPEGQTVLGAPDISSLADLGNAYEVLDRMRPVPFGRADAAVLVLAAVIPMTPLLLTVIPLEELLGLISKLLL